MNYKNCEVNYSVKVINHKFYQTGLFIEMKKSELFFVLFNLERINSIASIVPIELNIFLKTFIFSKSSFLKSNSSLRVPDLVISIAGKIYI